MKLHELAEQVEADRRAIWDIDNVLADDRLRVPLIDMNRENPDDRYAAYHNAMHLDPPYAAGCKLFHRRCVTTKPLFVTARPEHYRAETEGWLATFLKVPLVNLGPEWVLMRPDGDHTHSAELKVRVVREWLDARPGQREIAIAYDDRQDVLDAYVAAGITQLCVRVAAHDDYPPATSLLQAGVALRSMADTFEARQAIYKSNYDVVAKMMAALFPDGAPPKLLHDPRFHLFELICVKLSRYAIAEFDHQDSIHDAGVYAAMCEALGDKK